MIKEEYLENLSGAGSSSSKKIYVALGQILYYLEQSGDQLPMILLKYPDVADLYKRISDHCEMEQAKQDFEKKMASFMGTLTETEQEIFLKSQWRGSTTVASNTVTSNTVTASQWTPADLQTTVYGPLK